MADLKFRMTLAPSGADLTFLLLLGEGEALSATGDFVDRDACLAAIREVAEALNDEEPFSVRAVPGGHVLEVSGAAGRALARSRPQSEEAAEALRDALGEAAAEQEEYQIDLPPTMSTRAMTMPASFQAARVISADDYDFAWLSSSGLAGFEAFQNDRDGRYYFHFNDAQGEALLYSRGFGDASQRNKRLRAVMAGGATEQRYERREEGGRHFFFLKGRNGQEIARSRAFLTLGAMETALAWLWLEMPRQAEQYAAVQTKARKGSGSRRGLFNLALASLTGLAGFEMLRAADRRHYFLFNADDGRPLLFSQGYKTSAGRDQGVRSLIRLGANPARYQAAQEGGRHFFAIRAGNRQEIARSGDFSSAEAAAAAMRHLQAGIPAQAVAFGVAAGLLETASGESLTIHVPRAEALEEAARAPLVESAPLVAGAVVGAEAAALALHEAAPVESTPVMEAMAAPVVVEPAPTPIAPTPIATVPSAPAPTPVTPQRRPSSLARFWPIPLAVLALGCLAWGLNGHRPKTVAGVSKSAATFSPASPPVLASALLPSSAVPVTVRKKGPSKTLVAAGPVVHTGLLPMSTMPVSAKGHQAAFHAHPSPHLKPQNRWWSNYATTSRLYHGGS